jgi:hypothetical protein
MPNSAKDERRRDAWLAAQKQRLERAEQRRVERIVPPKPARPVITVRGRIVP